MGNQQWNRQLSSLLDGIEVDEDEVKRAEKTEEKRKSQVVEDQRAELREMFRNKKGRGWSDPYDLTDIIEQNIGLEDVPSFSPSLVSQVSTERVKIYEKDASGIPTLEDLSALHLPPPPPPLPGHKQSKAYALFRKRVQYNLIATKVKSMAEPKVAAIQALEDWNDRQEAVDVLFEDIEAKLKKSEVILGRHPLLGTWVERALEEFLQNIQKNANQEEEKDEATEEKIKDDSSVPIFMDCFDEKVDSKEVVAPKILHPLQGDTDPLKLSKGRMIGEWELAAHKSTKRIMLRRSTREIARILVEAEKSSTAARIYLHGKMGIGKTAAMLAIVASARKSGAIVAFVPDGNQFHQNYYYIEPNQRKKGIFDLPVLTQGVCKDILDAHKEDIASFRADAASMENHFTEEQLENVNGYESGGSIALDALLAIGSENTAMAPMCYSVAMDVLMNQDMKQFILAFDEFNCYFAPGHCFHMEFDDFYKNPKPIPYNQISLFKPAMDAMAIYCAPQDEEILNLEPVLMKRGAVIVATTESKAIARKVTDPLTTSAKHDPKVHAIEIPRLSALEVEHMVANYECTGIGKLRLDQGETVMNENEVEFLRMVSGAAPERLMNACVVDHSYGQVVRKRRKK